MSKSLISCFFGALLVGCGSSSDATNTPAADDAGTDVSDTAGPSGEKLQLLDAVHDQGVADVNVAVLAPDGTVISSAVTGADGIVTLSNVTWTDTPAWVVVWKKGYRVEVILLTRTGAAEQAKLTKRKPSDPPALLLNPITSQRPRLTGTIKGLVDDTHNVFVGALGGFYEGAGTSYDVRVLSGRPDSLICAEILTTAAPRGLTRVVSQWAIFERPAITKSGTLALDFSKPTSRPTTTHANVSVEITGGADGPLGGNSTVNLIGQVGDTQRTTVGVPLKTGANADGTKFEVVFESIDPKLGLPIYTSANITRPDGASSQVMFEGVPADGAVIKDFDLPIAVTNGSQTLSDPIAFETTTEGYRVLVGAVGTDSDFRVVLPTDVKLTTVKLPPLPSDALALLPATLTAQIGTWRGFFDWRLARSVTSSRAFTLTK